MDKKFRSNENQLSISFGESLSEHTMALVADLGELGLDGNLSEGLLKDVPFISTAISFYKIGKTIREKYHIQKLIEFINEMNRGVISIGKLQKYREKFWGNSSFRQKELEYIVLIIDRYIGFNKPTMLAKLYLAYLDNLIDWKSFLVYSEVVDRFLTDDYQQLISGNEITIINNDGLEVMLRLSALGLFKDITDNSMYREIKSGTFAVTTETMARFGSTDKTFSITPFGGVLANILNTF